MRAGVMSALKGPSSLGCENTVCVECLPGELQDSLQKLRPTSDLSPVFALCPNLGLVYILVKLRVAAARRWKRSSHALL